LQRNEEQIQNEVVNRYLKNLEYFQKNNIELFKKVELLSNAINQNLYKEKYALEYIKEIDAFDILSKEMNTYLYNKNFSKFNKKLVLNTTLSKNSTFSNLSKQLYKKHIENYELPDNKYNLLDEYLSKDMADLFELFSDTNTSDKYKYVDKMFFLGTLLGKHIEGMIKKISPKICFIYEPDLELFRLSLFITNYEEISNSTKVIYSVMDYENIFLQKIDSFISEYLQFSNYNIKYSKMDNISDDVIHKIITKLHLANTSTFDYTKVLYDTIYIFSKHINKYNILTLNNKNNDFNFLKDKPVLFVGAGPSLTKKIKWLKNNQNSFTIVAMGATYKKLFDNNIRVDIVTTVDQQFEVLDNSHFNNNDVELLKDTIVLASICTPSKILDRFNKEKLFLFETYQAFKENSKAYNGASIGEVTLSILLDMNIQNIYLLGIDLSIDEETGGTHYEGYKHQRKVNHGGKINSILDDGITNLREEVFEVKGNKKEKVITNRVFSLSISKYEQNIAEFKKAGQLIFNFSEESAFIEGVDFLCVDDFNKGKETSSLSKIELSEGIKKLSEYGLNNNEINKLEANIERTNNLRDFIENIFTRNYSKNIYVFNEKLEKIFIEIINTKDLVCSNLLVNYLNFSLPYIYLSLNDEKIKNKIVGKYIKNTEIILEKHLTKILDTYSFYLANILK
jgi:hypothetical protein